MNKKNKLITIGILIISLICTVGFSVKISAPKAVYRVYLKGKSDRKSVV